MDGLYYPSGETKGAGQLRGYREADLRLCFRICEKPVFSKRGSYYASFSAVPVLCVSNTILLHKYRCCTLLIAMY